MHVYSVQLVIIKCINQLLIGHLLKLHRPQINDKDIFIYKAQIIDIDQTTRQVIRQPIRTKNQDSGSDWMKIAQIYLQINPQILNFELQDFPWTTNQNQKQTRILVLIG